MLPIYFVRGNLQRVRASAVFASYLPMPNEAGLDVHLTLDLGGQVRFGPDVEWVDTINYDVDPCRAESFYARHSRLLARPARRRAEACLRRHSAEALGPRRAVCRVPDPGHGGAWVRGLVNLFGIKSPGLTACLAIAQRDCENIPGPA